MERPTRPASTMTHSLLRHAFKKVTEQHELLSEDWLVAFHVHVEEVLGPYERKLVGLSTIQFTRLQADPDGVHEFVTLTF
jgi:hypothetical protein